MNLASRWQRTVELAILVLIGFNIAEVLYVFQTRSSSGLYAPRTRFPLPAGYLADGRFMPVSAACYIVRLSSDGCPYCRRDGEIYTHLVGAAQQAGCKSVILSPKIGQIKPQGVREGTMQLEFIDMKFAQALIPLLTPQTFVLDRAGRIMWHREGAMDQNALSNALEVLSKLR